ncbi:MAG: hypothetical protein COB04_08940 [Gammaproteobacteria bacterium]|nr:MAG: hypothetical protein COB04_08940 [Gammaproteobacteria bacterium]
MDNSEYNACRPAAGVKNGRFSPKKTLINDRLGTIEGVARVESGRAHILWELALWLVVMSLTNVFFRPRWYLGQRVNRPY